jgi:hypothetical protein
MQRFLIYKILMLVSCLLFLSSCKKENMCDCMKSTGEVTSESRTLGNFNQIELNDNINLILTQDTVNSVKIQAGKHLLKLIKTDINNGMLYIKNDNRCNWVRSYKKEIYAYLHFKNLINLTNHGSGDISSTDTIRSNIIYIENRDGSGTIHLTIRSEQSYIKEHLGPADFYISGKTSYNYIWAAGYGIMDCRNLLSDDALVVNRGTNSCYVNVKNSLIAEIDYTGNIYYSGEPKTISTKIEGTGKLLQLK